MGFECKEREVCVNRSIIYIQKKIKMFMIFKILFLQGAHSLVLPACQYCLHPIITSCPRSLQLLGTGLPILLCFMKSPKDFSGVKLCLSSHQTATCHHSVAHLLQTIENLCIKYQTQPFQNLQIFRDNKLMSDLPSRNAELHNSLPINT